MTATQFVAHVARVARQQQRRVLAVDFEPDGERLALRFRFR